MAGPSVVGSGCCLGRFGCHCSGKILFDRRAKAYVRMASHIAQEVNAAGIDGEYLVVIFDLEFQPAAQVLPDLSKDGVKAWLVWRQDHQIIRIPEVIFYSHDLLKVVIQSGEVEISEILAEVVADREADGAVDYFVQEIQQPIILDLAPQQLLQDLMIDRRIEFPDIEL